MLRAAFEVAASSTDSPNWPSWRPPALALARPTNVVATLELSLPRAWALRWAGQLPMATRRGPAIDARLQMTPLAGVELRATARSDGGGAKHALGKEESR